MDITPEQTKCEITKSNFTCLYNENLSSRSQWESDIWTCVLMLPNPLPHTHTSTHTTTPTLSDA